MFRLLSILFLGLAMEVFAQPPIFIKDNFNNNGNGWWVGNGDAYSMKLENGKYTIITTQKDKGRFVTIQPYMEMKKDFSSSSATDFGDKMRTPSNSPPSRSICRKRP